jgi:hypothetical protein
MSRAIVHVGCWVRRMPTEFEPTYCSELSFASIRGFTGMPRQSSRLFHVESLVA